MSLPASLLAAVEAHPCFSGCYSREAAATLTVDPTAPAVTSYDVSCQECQAFRVGVLQSLLPANYTTYQLAADLSAHVRTVRGYAWAVSGYHANVKGGVWLSAASFGNGLLLVDAARNRGGASDLDVLVEAFKAGLVIPEDPGMIDPQHYAAEVVYVELSAPFGAVRSKQDILASKQCSRTPQSGFHRVTLLEFLPLAAKAPVATATPVVTTAPVAATPVVSAAAAAAAAMAAARAAAAIAGLPVAPVAGTPGASAQPAASPKRALKLGERCPVCNALVMRRELLTEYFEGCLC